MPRTPGRIARRLAPAVAVLALAAGCTPTAAPPTEPAVSKQDVIQLARNYLEAKYAQPFEFHLADWGGEYDSGLKWNGKNSWLGFYPPGGTPERYFRVQVDPTTTPLSFHDCYVGELMSPTLQSLAEAELRAIRPDARVAVVPMSSACQSGAPDAWKAPRPLAEFRTWADPNLTVLFCVYVPLAEGQGRADAEAQLPALTAGLKKVAGNGALSLRGYASAVFGAEVAPVLRPAKTPQGCWLNPGGQEPPLQATAMTGWRPEK